MIRLTVRSLWLVSILSLPSLSHAFVSPASHGGVPNDATDDSAAFAAAIAAVPATGGELFVPAGRWLLQTPISISGKPITIRGEGQRVSVLVFTHNTSGIVFDSTTISKAALNVSGVSILTGFSPGGDRAALHATFQSVGGGFHGAHGFISANIQDVHIGPDDFGFDNWNYGIVLVNATGAKVGRFNIIGNQGTSSYTALYGILVTGRSLGVRISQGDIYGWYYGIKTIDNAQGIEGTDISNVDTTDVNYGIYIQSPVHRPGTWISNCHTASRIRGIMLETQAQVFVENTLNYKLDNQPGWIGIHLLNVRDGKIMNNMSGRAGTGAANGIALHYTTINNIISGNTSNDLDGHIWIVDTTSYGNFITGNKRIGTGTAIVDNGTPGANPQTNNIL